MKKVIVIVISILCLLPAKVFAGNVSLTWDPPTQYLDGSVLNPAVDLQFYKLYYGTASQTYTNVVTIANPGGTENIPFTLSLNQGTYYFVVTSVTYGNVESGVSNEVSKDAAGRILRITGGRLSGSRIVGQ